MTDRELLEAAARAAGIELDPDSQNTRFRQKVGPLPEWVYWNPRDDNGDSFALAVRLRMEIIILSDRTEVQAVGTCIMELHGSDAEAATRRAIVLAAAAMDKGE